MGRIPKFFFRKRRDDLPTLQFIYQIVRAVINFTLSRLSHDVMKFFVMIRNFYRVFARLETIVVHCKDVSSALNAAHAHGDA